MHNSMRAALNLARAIEQRLPRWSYGKYCLQVRGTPCIPRPTSPAGQKLIAQARSYIGVTGGRLPALATELLYRDELGEICIEKREGNCVGDVLVDFSDSPLRYLHMNSDDEFLAAIQATACDPNLRLIYADWLEERGDPRAEFLRLQHQLAAALDGLQRLEPALDRAWLCAVGIRRDVVLHSIPQEHERAVTKVVRMHTCWGLEQTRATIAELPARILCNVPLDQAERVRQELAKFATVTIEPISGSEVTP